MDAWLTCRFRRRAPVPTQAPSRIEDGVLFEDDV
jgi:hypothetical protein